MVTRGRDVTEVGFSSQKSHTLNELTVSFEDFLLHLGNTQTNRETDKQALGYPNNYERLLLPHALYNIFEGVVKIDNYLLSKQVMV